MAAPAIVAILAFLGGSQAPSLGLFGIAGAAIVDVDGVVVDLVKLCKATDPLIDMLDDAFPKSAALNNVASAADKVCAAAAGGPGIAADAQLVGVALTAIGAAQAKLRGATTSVAIPNARTPLRAGR